MRSHRTKHQGQLELPFNPLPWIPSTWNELDRAYYSFWRVAQQAHLAAFDAVIAQGFDRCIALQTSNA